MYTTLPTVKSASTIRHMLADGTLPLLKTVIIGVSTSTMSTCSKGMPRMSTIVTNTCSLILRVSFSTIRLTTTTSTSELTILETVRRVGCQTSRLVLV